MSKIILPAIYSYCLIQLKYGGTFFQKKLFMGDKIFGANVLGEERGGLLHGGLIIRSCQGEGLAGGESSTITFSSNMNTNKSENFPQPWWYIYLKIKP